MRRMTQFPLYEVLGCPFFALSQSVKLAMIYLQKGRGIICK